MGASMGGLCSFLAMWRRSEVFGNCACLSPVFQAPLVAEVVFGGTRLKDLAPRIYIDNGGDTDERRVAAVDFGDGINPGYFWLDTQLQPGVDAMIAALELHDLQYEYFRDPGGRHNERGWAKRIDRPLLHLYGKREYRQDARHRLQRHTAPAPTTAI